jgi:hypothetical protein
MAKYLIIGDGVNIPANKDKVEPLLRKAGYHKFDFDELVETVIAEGTPLHVGGETVYLDHCLKFSKTEEAKKLRLLRRKEREEEKELDHIAYQKFVQMYRDGAVAVSV